MAAITTQKYTTNDMRSGRKFYNVNDMEPIKLKVSSLNTRPSGLEYQVQPIKPYGMIVSQLLQGVYLLYFSGSYSWCSKLCLTGLLIGLAIGAVVTLIVALPVGLTKTSALGTIASRPIWVGTYQMDNSCDRSLCCCLSNQITISRIMNNQIQLAGSATGTCAGSSTSVSLTQTMPIGFVVLFAWSGQSVRVIMGQDNAFVAFVNSNVGYCSGTAIRTSYNTGGMNSINLGLVILMLLITVGMNLFF